MTHPRGTLHTAKNTFYKNNSLLFQFLFNDLLIVLEEIGKLTEKGADISLALKKLTGSSVPANRRFLAWNGDTAPLIKLKNYCIVLLEQDGDNARALMMQHQAEKMWLLALLCLDIFQSGGDIKPHVKKLDLASRRFAKIFQNILSQLADDENVLFFILRHHRKIDLFFGTRFVYKLLSKMYPNGFKEAEQFLINSYRQRGFDNLIPFISSTLLEIA